MGEMDLANVYGVDVNPPSTDVLLLWTYWLNRHLSTGIAVLPRRAR
jgi:hypothetical protein